MFRLNYFTKCPSLFFTETYREKVIILLFECVH